MNRTTWAGVPVQSAEDRALTNPDVTTWPMSRRALLRTTAALGGAGFVTTASGLVVPADAARGARTTLDKRLRPGPKNGKGYRRVSSEHGEGHLVRTTLGIPAHKGRAKRRRTVLTFVQLSDVHIQDSQSPLRTEYLDRYSDEYLGEDLDESYARTPFRTQEMLTAQVGEAMVRAINKVAKGPVTGQQLAFAIQTGDNSDNCQLNEVRGNIDLLDGRKRFRPDSGDFRKFQGVIDNKRSSYDRRYWHPGGTPSGRQDDFLRSQLGFPTIGGLLGAARRPFTAQGLDMPWFAAFGNHDTHVQGGFGPGVENLRKVARGNLKMISPPNGMNKDDLIDAIHTNYAKFLADHADTPVVRRVAADKRRRVLTHKQVIAEHFDTSGSPNGHGFTAQNRRDGHGYYSFTRGKVLFLVLDTVNPNGGPTGSLNLKQLQWLNAKIEANRDKAVILASHHNIKNLKNDRTGEAAPNPRILGPRVVRALLKHKNVIAWINGHSHTNQIRAFKRDDGTGGFWEINTASHIDWPQQSRIIEVVDNRDGTMSIFATMLDHLADASYGRATGSVLKLASISRELALNDWQSEPKNRTRDHNDRNVELLVRTPKGLR